MLSEDRRGADRSRPRVAVVIQRFAEDTGGGAEEHCRSLVLALRETWDIDVVSTCARDHHSWANVLPAGAHQAEGYRIIRFPVVRPKRRVLSAVLSRALPRLPHPGALDRLWARSLGPDAPSLLDFLEKERSRYAAVIFYTYLYATTVLGIERAGPRTLLIPTAHHEPMLRLPLARAGLARAGALGFLTPEERELVRSIAGSGDQPDLILGAELPPAAWVPGDAEAFRKRHAVEGPFLLYLGRIERSKGLRELLRIYGGARESLPPLVLAGRLGPLALPRWARALGYLPEEEKRGALAACAALVQPSARESLSLVALEAWAQRRPVIANRACAALAGQCARSGGGVTYRGPAEFAAAVQGALDAGRKATLGESGFGYARANYGEGSLRSRLVPFLEGLGWIAPAVPERHGAIAMAASGEREP